MFIAIDIGTTNLKVGLFEDDGSVVKIHSTPMDSKINKNNNYYFDPTVLWDDVAKMIHKITEEFSSEIIAISITSMAESGLLIERNTGKISSNIIPWFDTSSAKHADFIESQINRTEHFYKTGLYPSYKQGLSKLLFLKENNPAVFKEDSVWLSVSSYIAYCLTNEISEEKTLAARTFAFNIYEQKWDDDLISSLGFSRNLFPPVHSSTTSVGPVLKKWEKMGLKPDTNVYIAGHDHLVASLSVGEITTENVYNSVGTAETLIGNFPKRNLTKEDAKSGLTFGLHLIDDTYHWMGGHSSSGGSIEWIRDIISSNKLSYSGLNNLLHDASDKPTGIIFLPYLNGSGAPSPNSDARASFLGLTKNHGKSELLKSIIEGNSYQMEWIREVAQKITNSSIENITAVGGGTENKYWMQIKSTVSGVNLNIPEMNEATLSGSVLVAATGEGLYSTLKEAAIKCAPENTKEIYPNTDLHADYKEFYRNKFLEINKLLNK